MSDEMTLDELENLSSEKIEKSILIQFVKFLDNCSISRKISKAGIIGNIVNLIIIILFTSLCIIFACDNIYTNKALAGMCWGIVVTFAICKDLAIGMISSVDIKMNLNYWQYLIYTKEIILINRMKADLGLLITSLFL